MRLAEANSDRLVRDGAVADVGAQVFQPVQSRHCNPFHSGKYPEFPNLSQTNTVHPAGVLETWTGCPVQTAHRRLHRVFSATNSFKGEHGK